MDIVINGLEEKVLSFAYIPYQGPVQTTDFDATFNVEDADCPEEDEVERYLDKAYECLDAFLNSIDGFDDFDGPFFVPCC